MSNDQFADAVALVADTSTPVAMLRILCNTYPTLRAQIALHPNADAALLDQLADDPDPAVKLSASVARQRVDEPATKTPAKPDVAEETPAYLLLPPPSSQQPVIAASRGTRCGKCGAYLFRAPNEESKTCPSCGVLNLVSTTGTPQGGASRGTGAGHTSTALPHIRSSSGNIFGSTAAFLAVIIVISFILTELGAPAVFSWIYVLSSIAAIVFGVLGIKAVGRGDADNLGAAITGMVFGIVGCVFFLIGMMVLGVIISSLG